MGVSELEGGRAYWQYPEIVAGAAEVTYLNDSKTLLTLGVEGWRVKHAKIGRRFRHKDRVPLFQ